MSDDEFKQMVGKALVSFDQKFSELNRNVSGIDRKLDGIGTYLHSSDRTHQETSKRISALEDRVDKLEKKRDK